MWTDRTKKRYSNPFLLLAMMAGLMGIFLPGCRESVKIEEPQAKQTLDPYATVGSLAEIVAFRPISVKGIGLVMLPGETGSAECPPSIREYLKQYILTRTPGKTPLNATELINSKKTAVVMVEGEIPAGALLGDIFDAKVTSLPNTQTISLSGGKLFTTDMHMAIPSIPDIGTSKTMAVTAGAVFIDKIGDAGVDLNTGYILAGGKITQSQKTVLALFEPNYKMVGLIRNRINERFGSDVANAVSDSIIYLSVPDAFRQQKEKFINLVKALYLAPNASSQAQQIDKQIENLRLQVDKRPAEISLEAIGKSSLIKLEKLLSSSEAGVRLSVARCMLNIGGGNRELKILRDIAQDKDSGYRIEALDAVGTAAKRKDVVALMSRLINDDDFEIRFAAYKYLRKFDNITISRTIIAGDFYVEEVYQTTKKVIFASRNSTPRIVLFGSPINCQEDVFIESDDGRIIINARKDDKYMSVMRKDPGTGNLIGPLKCRYEVGDLVRTLGAPLVADKQKKQRSGLEIPYSDIIALLEKMCQRGAIEADLITSGLPSTF